MTPDTFHRLLATGVKHGASDIHFRPGSPPAYRVKKQLVPLKGNPLTAQMTEAIAKIVSAKLGNIACSEIQELDTSYSLPGVARFRVNVYRQRGSLGLVLRIIPDRVKSIAELALPAVLEKVALQERGLVLVTGATGSGKTTTLAALIDHVNEKKAGHILTIEDPIEFLHRNKTCHVSQREIGLDTLSYVTGMRSALRQDPDVILVGEMRDRESIDIGLKAAETGHVVFSTVHTTDAEKTIGRLIAVYPANEQKGVRLRLADNLQAIVSQRLLPRADDAGMVVACEVMLATARIKQIIRDPKEGSMKDTIEQGKQHYGMQSFDQHLIDLLQKRLIRKETAFAAASSPADLERALTFEV